jgi:hypothetical protein
MENIVQPDAPSQESFNVDLSALENIQTGVPAESSPDSNVHTNTEESQIEIDERFRELDPTEGRIRTLQSQRDQSRAAQEKLRKDYDERDQVAGLLDQMLEDEGLLMAFIAETKPELVKNRDVASELKKQLMEEFGQDFKPQLTREEAERDDPFGSDYKYYMRVDELRAKLKVNGEAPQSVKEYLRKKRERTQLESAKYENERQTVKAQKKMSDEELKAVSDWALTLKFGQIVDIHRYLRKRPSANPNLTSVPGGGEIAKSAKDKFLDETMPIRRP